MHTVEEVKNNLKQNEEILAIAQYKKSKSNIVFSILCVVFLLGGIIFSVAKDQPQFIEQNMDFMYFIYMCVCFGLAGLFALIDGIVAIRVVCSGCLRKNKFLVVTNQRIIGITNTRKSVLINFPITKVQCAYLYTNDNMRVIINSKAYVFQILINAKVLAEKIDEQLDMRDERQQKKEQQASMANNSLNGVSSLGKEVLY